MLSGNPMTGIARLHQIQRHRPTRRHPEPPIAIGRHGLDQRPQLVGDNPNHHRAERIDHGDNIRAQALVSRAGKVEIDRCTLRRQQLAIYRSTVDTADHHVTTPTQVLDIARAHRVAVHLAPVPEPADIAHIHLTSSDHLPRPPRAKRPAPAGRHLSPSQHRITRHRPRVPEPHPRQIPDNHQLTDPFWRHAKHHRCISQRQQIRTHNPNILE